MEGVDHTINITFNKDLVPGAPFTAKIHTGKNTIKHYNNCYYLPFILDQLITQGIGISIIFFSLP